ncbi:hypothetical protein [Mangrovibacter yixingensis]|uniref:hypothetical protein n=1 Tax=Mangrovibacter yixingensis TaxID=1529639 RepID=UPI001CFA3A6E|nr:hypothetical protein [Mangrovibacter yixingensis]
MKKTYKALVAVCLMAAGATAFAAQQETAKSAHHEGQKMMAPRGHGQFMPPMMMPPVYQSSMQTSDPAEALKKLTGDVPALEKGKRYDVRVEVRELPPLPPVPAPAAKEKPAEQPAG